MLTPPGASRRTNLSALSAPRTPLRRVLDVWGWCPGFGVASRDVSLTTRDGVRLAGSYLPGPVHPQPPSAVPAVVLAHGFAAHRRKPAYAYLAERLSSVAAVLSIDLRGHGGSGGVCTLGEHEAFDVRAAASWLRRHGHQWVAVIGASMGGTAAIRAAASGPSGCFDAVCAISAPAQWGLVDSPAMRALTRAVTQPWLRVATGALLRIRLRPGGWPRGMGGLASWEGPAQPVGVVARLAPAPLLLVHGVDDHFYGPEQARQLLAAAGEPKTLWLEPPGFGHAEDGFRPPFADRLADALLAVRESGIWPGRPVS